MFKYPIIFILLITGVYGDERPVVKTQNGLIRGVYRKSVNGLQFTSFEGIPYAKPPTGELRFKAPVPKEQWTGIWDADNEYICIQMSHSPLDTKSIEGNEDCLYLNVYSPKLNDDTATMDVVIHIHGGAFMFGQGNLYGPNILMDRDVVYVTLNYRLGPLGFLATEDNISPGNYGLKDQSLALKWIKQNIAAFGGNPESITITGMSAGGASVHFHYLSPLSRNLFQRGMSISGSSISNWALVERPLEKARQLGLAVGCGQQKTQDLVTCLRQRPAKQLAQASKTLQVWLYNPYSPFGPVVEPVSVDAFLTAQPYDLIRTGKVADLPWICTVTASEGLYPAADFMYSDDRLPYLEQNWNKLAPFILHYDGTVEKDSWAEVAQKIREHYLGDRKISKETFHELVQAIGDRLFIAEADKVARLQAKINKSPVYFYIFSYRGDHSVSEYYSRKTDNFGVSHADDVFYVISPDPSWFSKHMQSKDDKKLSKIITDMWLSFAQTGEPKLPNIKWETVSKNVENPLKLLNILGPEKLIMEEVNELGHRSFWDSLPITENDKIAVIKDEL